MGTPAASETPGPTLAGVVVSDNPLDASGASQAVRQSAGSARWPLGPEGPAYTQIGVFLQAARALGTHVPDDLLFRAGQVIYRHSQAVDVRLSGLLPGPPDATGQPAFTPWSTPTPPALTAGLDGGPSLDPSVRDQPHFSALVVPEQAGALHLVLACVWDLREPTAPRALGPTLRRPEDHLIVLNPAHYHAVRESLTHNTFTTAAESPWPTAPIATGPARGVVQLRPVMLETQDWMSPEDTDRWAARMWEQRKELSDLDADALDALCALWLTQAQRVDEDVVGDIDALLAMPGLQPKRNGGGQAGGYRPEQRAAMWRAVLHVQNLWVHLSTMEVYQYLGLRPRRHQPTAETIQSRVVAITDRLGHLRPDGFFDVEKFIFRPGKVFAHFLFGTGRQTALLAAQALRYDPVRQTWEKRLARYFSYQWRCKAYAGDLLQPFKVASLLAAVGASLNSRKPFLTRAHLEKALETLLRDRLIAAWQYDRWDEACTTRRGWAQAWLHATILIEPPDSVRHHYQQLTRHEARAPLALPAPLTLGARLRQRRQQLGLTLTQVAEQLGVSPSYLHRVEQGSRGKRPTAKLQQAFETWLAAPLGQDEAPPA